MVRLPVAIGVIVILILVAGCNAFGGLSSPPPEPDKPTPVTADNVVDFAVQHGTAALYERFSGGDVDCDGALHPTSADGYVVLLECDVVKSIDGGHLDAFPAGAYFVDDETTRGVWRGEDSYRHPLDSVYGQNRSDAVSMGDSLRLYNFANTTPRVTVNLTYVDGETPEHAFAREYSLPARSTIWQVGPTVRPGTYRVTVTYDEETTTYRWTLPESGSDDHETEVLYVYLGPDGTLTVEPGPDRHGIG